MIDNLHVTLETTHIELHSWYRKGQREQHLPRAHQLLSKLIHKELYHMRIKSYSKQVSLKLQCNLRNISLILKLNSLNAMFWIKVLNCTW